MAIRHGIDLKVKEKSIDNDGDFSIAKIKKIANFSNMGFLSKCIFTHTLTYHHFTYRNFMRFYKSPLIKSKEIKQRWDKDALPHNINIYACLKKTVAISSNS